MEIREYREADIQEIVELFFNTVHGVCNRDYTQEQLDAWAGPVNADQWNRMFLEHDTLVVAEDGKIVGFGDIDSTGYLDHLFVHKDYQGQGIATALCDRLESHFLVNTITTHASITAKPFFEARGYGVVREQQVMRRGVVLTNYVMEKPVKR